MNNLLAATEMRVTYDEKIQHKSELFGAVQEAQTYFEQNYPVPEGSVLKTVPSVKWEWLPNGSDFHVLQTFIEVADSQEPLEIRNRWKTSQLLDSGIRNFLVLNLLRSILHERVRRRSKKIDSLMKQLDRGENDADKG